MCPWTQGGSKSTALEKKSANWCTDLISVLPEKYLNSDKI